MKKFVPLNTCCVKGITGPIPDIALYCFQLQHVFRLSPPQALFTTLPQQGDKWYASPCFLKWQQDTSTLWRSQHCFNKTMTTYIIRRATIFVFENAKVWENKVMVMSSVQLFSADCWPTDSMFVSANTDCRLRNYSTGQQVIPERISKLSKYSWFCETAAIQDQIILSQMRLMKSFYLDEMGRSLGIGIFNQNCCLLARFISKRDLSRGAEQSSGLHCSDSNGWQRETDRCNLARLL